MELKQKILCTVIGLITYIFFLLLICTVFWQFTVPKIEKAVLTSYVQKEKEENDYLSRVENGYTVFFNYKMIIARENQIPSNATIKYDDKAKIIYLSVPAGEILQFYDPSRPGIIFYPIIR